MTGKFGEALLSLINDLRLQRRQVLDEIERIDKLCDQLGIQRFTDNQTDSPSKPALPPNAQVISIPAHVKPVKKRRTRGVFAKTAEQSLLDFITLSPEPVTKEQILAHWQAEGRAGKPDSTLSKLTRSGKLERDESQTQQPEPPDEEFDPDADD